MADPCPGELCQTCLRNLAAPYRYPCPSCEAARERVSRYDLVAQLDDCADTSRIAGRAYTLSADQRRRLRETRTSLRDESAAFRHNPTAESRGAAFDSLSTAAALMRQYTAFNVRTAAAVVIRNRLALLDHAA